MNCTARIQFIHGGCLIYTALPRVRTVHGKTDWTQYPILHPQFRPTQDPIRPGHSCTVTCKCCLVPDRTPIGPGFESVLTQALPHASPTILMSCRMSQQFPCTQTNYGDRTSAVYGPHVCNSLPDEVRSTDVNLTTFRICYYLTCNCSLAHLWHPAKVCSINVLNNNTNNSQKVNKISARWERTAVARSLM